MLDSIIKEHLKKAGALAISNTLQREGLSFYIVDGGFEYCHMIQRTEVSVFKVNLASRHTEGLQSK